MADSMKHDIAFFDFLRGWAALLVFFHHAALLGGGPAWLTGEIGQEAVNAFMLASGFLIFFQVSISRSYGGLRTRAGIANFYIRRWFRIAPAYYVSLIIALLVAADLGDARQIISATLGGAGTDMSRYYIDEPLQSLLLHVTFLFGLLPDHAFSTPLPDWSLGLEMQFYLFFPVLFFFYRRRFLPYFALSILAMFGLWAVVKLFGISYPMPSFLPLRFHNFAAGIALAYLLLNPDIGRKREYLILGVTLAGLMLGNRSAYLPLLFLFGWWWICKSGPAYGPRLMPVQRLFRHRSSKFLAEVSYSVYIVHLMLMLPFFAWLLGDGPVAPIIWLTATLALLAGVMAIGYVMYRGVEVPGIRLGKLLIERRARRAVGGVEDLAAREGGRVV